MNFSFSGLLIQNAAHSVNFVFQGIFIFSMIQYRPLTMAGYTYPWWAQALGWIIALVSVVCIPLGMVHAVYTAKGSNMIKVRRVHISQ